jgi:hypothetical protein
MDKGRRRRRSTGARPSLERGGVEAAHPHDVRLRRAVIDRQVGCSSAQRGGLPTRPRRPSLCLPGWQDALGCKQGTLPLRMYRHRSQDHPRAMLALCSRSEGSGIVRQPWFISAGRKTNTARTTRLAHQVENGLALHYHQTGSVMIASASPPKKELMQKNIRMSSTLVMCSARFCARSRANHLLPGPVAA